MNDPESTGSDVDLVRTLVDLCEVLDAVNTGIRREAETRSGQSLLPTAEVSVLVHLLRHPDSTPRTIASATSDSRAAVEASARSLQRRGLIIATAGGTGPDRHYRATAAGVALRNTARERALQRMRYTLAGLAPAEVDSLRQAVGGLDALVGVLGFREIHGDYADDPELDEPVDD